MDDPLEDGMVSGGSWQVQPRHLHTVARRVRAALQRVNRRIDRVAADALERDDRIRARIDALDGRLDPIEARLRLVDDLPPAAPFGALLRLRGDGALYLGNGPNQPLTKIVPEQV